MQHTEGTLMQIDNGTIKRNALQLILDANALLVRDSDRSFYIRMVAMHTLFNVVDYVLGLMEDSPYTGNALCTEHRKYAEQWRKELHIRTCDECSAHMHDMYAVPCRYPSGDIFVLCETCAILKGFAGVCPMCTLVYSYDDMVQHVPAYIAQRVLTGTVDAELVSFVCVDCFPALTSRCPAGQ